MGRCRAAAGFTLLAMLCSCAGSSHPASAELTVSVAASLESAMLELGPLFEESHPASKVSFNFGGSGTLEQQIEQGAPADIFLAAAPKPMDALSAQGLLLAGTRRDLLRNQVVLIVPQGSTGPESFSGLKAPPVKLIALGDPGSVPAGDYGRQVLRTLGLWEAVETKLVLAKDVRQVLTYVETGEADAGIVYATDARDSQKVRVAAEAPANSHQPVVYPVAVLRGSRHASAARAFLTFLTGPAARAVFLRRGFTPAFP